MGTEKEEYTLGDDFEIRFQISQESYITLMDISPEGDITFIVPSIKVQDNKVEADKVYSTFHHFDLPIKIAPPTGYETINLFVRLKEFAFFETNFEQEPFYTIKKDDEERLNKLIAALEKLNDTIWTGTSVQFFIRSSTRGAGPSTSRKFGAIPPIAPTGTTGKFFPPIAPTGTTGNQRIRSLLNVSLTDKKPVSSRNPVLRDVEHYDIENSDKNRYIVLYSFRPHRIKLSASVERSFRNRFRNGRKNSRLSFPSSRVGPAASCYYHTRD